MLEGPDVLVGRRGSGKSSLLRSFRARNFLLKEFQSDYGREFRDRFHITAKALTKTPDFVVDVDTPSQVYELEAYCLKQPQIPPVETLAELWRRRLWWLVGRQMDSAANRWWAGVPDDVKRYIRNEDISATVGGTSRLQNDLTPQQYISRLESYLHDNSLRVVATFDNVEEHKFEPAQNAVLGGLIAATGKFIGAQHPCLDVKLCLPAELFRQLERITFRPDKDLHRVQYLHWNAAELMHLAARRLRVYLLLWNSEEFDLVRETRIIDRPTLMSFWRRYLPDTIRNSVGVRESSITYILRHTQLLPRHLISVLNAICKRFKGDGAQLFSRKFTDHEVIKGVQDTEKPNVQAVLFMFRRLYPEIDDLFQAVMPRLSREFDYGDLQSVWQSSAKSLMARMHKPEFIAFWQLMFATGSIGLRMEGEGSALYSVARFEFNTKYGLSISDKDRLCVHPMFSRIYNLEQRSGARLILPRGSDFGLDREQI